jgi:hypothetical protein
MENAYKIPAGKYYMKNKHGCHQKYFGFSFKEEIIWETWT